MDLIVGVGLFVGFGLFVGAIGLVYEINMKLKERKRRDESHKS